MDKSVSKIKYVKDRLGHDNGYFIDASKIKSQLNWKPKYDVKEGLIETIDWYQENKSWWEN